MPQNAKYLLAVAFGYFIMPNGRAHYAYCPPRGGRGYSHARGVGHHR